MLRKKFKWKLGALQVIDDKNGYRFSEIEDIKDFSMTTGNKE
jgi:hypothetical protein